MICIYVGNAEPDRFKGSLQHFLKISWTLLHLLPEKNCCFSVENLFIILINH